MKRISLWLVAILVSASGGVVTYVRCPGCIPRDRVNTNCEWTGDARFALDSSVALHRQHLVADAQLAEELGIRYADAEFARRGGGVEHHGGLLDDGRVRGQCLDRMFRAIEDSHGTAPGEIRLARGVRSAVYDAAVVLMFLPFYSLVAASACRWVTGRFGTNERVARWTAVGLASLALTLLGTQIFRLWGGVWEVVRVGNGHMTSMRSASQAGWVHQYPGADLLGGLVLFWLVALVCFRAAPQHAHDDDPQAPHAMLLR